MDKNFAETVKQVIAIAWRRRKLLVAPVLIMAPAIILVIYLMPRKYEATALLVLTESDRTNPFNKARGIDYSLQKRVQGLEAWLKSEHVLSGIQRQFTKLDPDANPVAFAFEVKSLRDAIKVELVGSDFLKFSLIGSKAKGMGEKLEVITARVLAGLMVPDQSVVTAGRYLLQHRKKKLSRAIQALEEFRVRRQKELAALDESNEKDKIERLKQKIRDGRKRKSQLDEQIEKLANIGRGKIMAAGQEKKNDLLSSLNRKTQAKPDDDSKRKLADLRKERDRVIFDLVNANSRLRNFHLGKLKLGEVQAKQLKLEYAVERARKELDLAIKNVPAVSIKKGLGLINAPEGIKLIDVPQDPKKAMHSRMKMALAAVMASIILSLALAILAELADPIIRDRKQFAKIGKSRIVGNLPPID
jgi:capsular polysaccharide biosynthesis protein